MSSESDQNNEVAHTDLHEALTVATAVALEAGALLRDALYEGAEVSAVESSGEVHALADLQAERLIRARLTERFPSWGLRSEEEPELNRAPQDELERFWLVDPNDGTSAFIKGERGASVSIALIERGEPALGVIYAYMGLDDRGDLFTWARGCGPLRRNGAPVPSTELWAERWEETTALVSNSADTIADAYLSALDGARFRVAPGVAYRLALAAAGEADLAISLAGPRDFDYAAGHALLVGAGGDFIDEQGRSVSYHPTRPQRLGFGFGGAPWLTARLTSLAWGPVLQRDGRRPVSLWPPRHADLCSASETLAGALGAWWGWHLAWALSGPEHPSAEALMQLDKSAQLSPQALHALESQVALQGGDAELCQQLRATLSQAQPTELTPLHAHPLRGVLLELVGSPAPAKLKQLAPQTGGARALLCERLARQGARAAMRTESSTALGSGGHGWPPRLIGALLSYRGGEMSRWGSDSARLLEAWLTALSRSGERRLR